MPKPFFHTRNKIDEIIRVDHAGEFGAKRIYEGQIKYSKDPAQKELIQHMMDQEQEHLDYFSNAINTRNVRPTLMFPIWNLAGYYLGALSAMMSPKTAMLVTESVEEIIEKHYDEQIQALSGREDDLIKTLQKFREDEIEHKTIATENGSSKAPFAKVTVFVVQIFCKLAINISKKL